MRKASYLLSGRLLIPLVFVQVMDAALQTAREEGYVVEEADDDDAGSEDALHSDALDLDGPSSLVSEGLQIKEGWSVDEAKIV
jgi:hypothetical protein